MAEAVTEISEEQTQELIEAIINQCNHLGLETTQILYAIARSLLGATLVLGTKELTVEIENQGSVKVSVFEENN